MKKILSLLLACVLVMSCFAGCAKTPDKPSDPTTPPTSQTDPNQGGEVEKPNIKPDYPTFEVSEGAGFTNFDTDWIKFMNQNRSGENYMISPLSLKMAIALAAAGANTETLDEMLAAFEFATLDEYLGWAKAIVETEKEINESIESMESNKYIKGFDNAFDIANSIWHNSDTAGHFLDLYKGYMEELDAVFMETPGAELKDEINSWVNEKTNGMIPKLFEEDLSSHTNILINTLYMKCNWVNTFSDYRTKEDNFTTITGDIVQKEMMNQEEDFRHYIDEDCELLILPMEHGINMAIVLGRNDNIVQKIAKAEKKLVNVTMPKFEIETTTSDIINFLKTKGINLAFDSEIADFSNMMDTGNYINQIIQKTKIKLDENGVEAAAVTAVVMDATSALPQEPPKPIYFIADEPFTFYIYTNVGEAETPELLFYGQYVK